MLSRKIMVDSLKGLTHWKHRSASKGTMCDSTNVTNCHSGLPCSEIAAVIRDVGIRHPSVLLFSQIATDLFIVLSLTISYVYDTLYCQVPEPEIPSLNPAVN